MIHWAHAFCVAARPSLDLSLLTAVNTQKLFYTEMKKEQLHAAAGPTWVSARACATHQRIAALVIFVSSTTGDVQWEPRMADAQRITAKQAEEKARECRRMASQTNNSEHQAMLKQMAEAWEQIARSQSLRNS